MEEKLRGSTRQRKPLCTGGWVRPVHAPLNQCVRSVLTDPQPLVRIGCDASPICRQGVNDCLSCPSKIASNRPPKRAADDSSHSVDTYAQWFCQICHISLRPRVNVEGNRLRTVRLSIRNHSDKLSFKLRSESDRAGAVLFEVREVAPPLSAFIEQFMNSEFTTWPESRGGPT